MFLCSNTHARKKNYKKLPPLNVLAQINDSIIKEGMMLYTHEVMSWRLTDHFFLKQHKADEVGASLVYTQNDSIWSAIFVDKENNCIFEYRLNAFSLETEVVDTIRSMTRFECDLLTDKQKKIDTAIKVYGDSLNWLSSEIGNFNFDLLQIGNHSRLYILQGISKNNIIPFGNDYAIDFNEDNEIVKFRRLHKSFIPVSTVMENGEKVVEVYHSHLQDNPFITTTDICNYLLYGRSAGLTSFSVISTYYHCRFTYYDNQIYTVLMKIGMKTNNL